MSCSRPAPSRGPASYLAVSDSSVGFIQWHAMPHGHLHGIVTAARASGSAPGETLSVSRTPFTGTMRGNSVTLTFPAMLFLHASTHGTLGGGTLKLRLPQPDGSLKQVTFRTTNMARYHRAVAALHETISRANAQEATQLAGRSRRQISAQVSARAEQLAVSALSRDASLAPGGVLPRTLARFADDTQTARSDLETEKQDAAGSNSYCKAAFTVGGDAQKVSGDLRTVQGDTEAMIPAITNIRSEMASARVSMRQLTRAGLPAPGSASAVIADAQGATSRVIAMANSYIDQVNAIGATARSVASNIAAGRCSSARVGYWAPPVMRVH